MPTTGKKYVTRILKIKKIINYAKIFKELFFFNVIGVINTAITYAIYSTLVFAGTDYKVALILEYCFGITFSFFLNRHFTFHHKEPITLYMVLSMIGSYLVVLALNMVLLVFLVEKLAMNKYFGQLIALAVSVTLSFLAQKYIVFSGGKKETND
jgi:putative flippase GtrA